MFMCICVHIHVCVCMYVYVSVCVCGKVQLSQLMSKLLTGHTCKHHYTVQISYQYRHLFLDSLVTKATSLKSFLYREVIDVDMNNYIVFSIVLYMSRSVVQCVLFITCLLHVYKQST